MEKAAAASLTALAKVVQSSAFFESFLHPNDAKHSAAKIARLKNVFFMFKVEF